MGKLHKLHEIAQVEIDLPALRRVKPKLDDRRMPTSDIYDLSAIPVRQGLRSIQAAAPRRVVPKRIVQT